MADDSKEFFMKFRSLSTLVCAALTSLMATTLTTSAFAQDPPPADSGTGTATGTGATGGSTTFTTARTSQAKPHERDNKDDDGLSDHEKVVGRFAVGYLGVSDIPLPTATLGGANPTLADGKVSAPVIGVRYWLNPRIGIDGGLGIGWSGGSAEQVNGNTTTTTTIASRFGVLLHAGVPVALVSAKHYTFIVVPELNVGFATSSVAPPTIPGQAAGANVSLSGFKLDIGARAGTEIHFGFIGVPQLALQATVGVAFSTQSQSAKRDNFSQSASATTIGTTVQADPWSLFTKNISALYYF
jgi:hypothetical protein